MGSRVGGEGRGFLGGRGSKAPRFWSKGLVRGVWSASSLTWMVQFVRRSGG